MKITLLNPRLKTWSPNAYVPLGLGYIAASLEQAGHYVEIIDLNVQRVNNTQLQKRLVGSEIIGMTGMITEYQTLLGLVDIVKAANVEARVILGGPLATALPQKLLQESAADFIVLGEGEKTIVDLISAIGQGGNVSGIKGIAFKTDGRINITEPVEPIADLDTIPFPARHLLDMKRYIKDHFESFGIKIRGFGRVRSTNLVSSRGCPYSCTFCFKDMS